MLKRICLLPISLFIFINSFPINSLAKTIEDFLAQQKTIRVFVDNSPGFGDQSATAGVMSQIRKMGFNGTFEVVYGNVTTPKVTTIFNLPANVPDVYQDEKNHITFIKLKAHFDNIRHHKIELANFGFSVGKSGGVCTVSEADGLEVPDNGKPNFCDNNAISFAVKTYVDFSPYFDIEGGIHDTTYIDILDKPSIAQQDSGNKFLVLPVATFHQADDFLTNDPAGKLLLAQKPALATLMQGIKNQQFNLLPVYGFTIQSHMCNSYGDAFGCYPGNILQIAMGARYAQVTGGADFNKPLIITIFYDYEKDAKQLLNLINSDHWGEFEIPGAEIARNAIKSLGMREAFSIANIEDADAAQRIQNLKPGQILLLWTGSLPKTVFDGIYTHTSSNMWPQVREGANSFDSLVLTGKAHVRCGADWELGYDFVTTPAIKSRLEDFYSSPSSPGGSFCDGMNTWAKNETIYQEWGRWIIESHDVSSPFSQYFQRIKVEALKPENDRVRFALEGIMAILNDQEKH